MAQQQRVRPDTLVPGWHRSAYLDGLRGIAIVGVLFSHLASHASIPGRIGYLLSEGGHGVELFFVLSGFCLAFPILAKLRGPGATTIDIARFGAKRLVRLVPPFYIATAALIVIIGGAHFLRHHEWPQTIPAPHAILASLLFFDGKVELINSSFWTLMVEFRWYIAFPLLLALWIRSPRAFIAVGAASILIYHFTRARGLDFGTLPCFMLGIIAAELQLDAVSTKRWAQTLRRFAIPFGIIALIAGIAVESRATIPGSNFEDVLYPYQPTILGWQLAVFFLVVALGHNERLRALFSVKPLTAIGFASYSIFLIHEPILKAVPPSWLDPAGIAVTAAAALAAGFAFCVLFERPFRSTALRDTLVERLTPFVARVLNAIGIGTSLALVERKRIETDRGETIGRTSLSPMRETIVP